MPGNDAVDHNQKDQCKERHDSLALGSKLRLGFLHAHLDLTRADAHYGPGWIFFHPGGLGN